jgi:PAS domain S-box-containing protein
LHLPCWAGFSAFKRRVLHCTAPITMMKSEKKPSSGAKQKAKRRPPAPGTGAAETADILKKRLAESQRVAAIGSFERDLATGEGYWSDELYHLLGFAPGQVDSVRSVFISRLHPEDRAAVMAALARVSGHGGAFNLETRYLTQNGRVRHARFRAVADTDASGKPVRLYGTFQDITEARAAREALSDSENRYQTLVENASDVIHTLDAAGHLVFASKNLAAKTGVSLASLMGRPFAEYVHPEDREDFRNYFDLVMEGVRDDLNGRAKIGVEFRMGLKNGQFIWFKTLGSKLPGNDHAPELFLGVARDVTERKQAEDARRDMELMLQHDMRSPLQGVIQLPLALSEDENLDPRQRRLLGVVSNCGRRMLRLIEFFMSLGKLETGLYRPVSEPVDLVAVCREIVEEFSEKAKNLDVAFALASEGGELMADEALIVKGDKLLCFILFENLLINALEASPPGAAVEISFRRLGKTALAAIHNLGAVPEEIRSRFFEKYATCGKPGGTGLGAYSARLIAESLGGAISLRTGEDEGTTLAVTLPL